ncbi:hypothetical protein [Peribacillus deserti]|nr:hypothetical protein [Peribacillus deserti]
MDQKPDFYDGSSLDFLTDEFTEAQQPFLLTPEMRGSISCNPYTFEINE